MPPNHDIPKAQHRAARAAAAVVETSRRHAWPLVAVLTVLAAVLAVVSARAIDFNSDTSQMLSRDLPFRKANEVYRKAFPDYRNAILIVIDGKNPDQVEDGARALAARL